MNKISPAGILLTQTRRPSAYEMTYWKENGFTPFYQSLLAVSPVAIEPLDAEPQAIVLTSANAALALEASSWNRDIPVFGVGAATVQMAKAAGFTDCYSPSDKHYPSAVNLLNWMISTLDPRDGKIIFGCGQEVRHELADALDKAGFATQKIILYQTQPVKKFSKTVETNLKTGLINSVVLQSEQAIKAFVHLCATKNIDYKLIKLLVPSPFLKACAQGYGFSTIDDSYKNPNMHRRNFATRRHYRK